MGTCSCTCRLKRLKKGKIPQYQKNISDAFAIKKANQGFSGGGILHITQQAVILLFCQR
jgi:hypothetical protein